MNALHFKGEWAEKFNPKHTEMRPFYLGSGEKIEVAMMSITDQFRTGYLADARFLEMPYKVSLLYLLSGVIHGIKFFFSFRRER